MNLISPFWNDDEGAVVSAEVVLVGSLAVLAGVVGLNSVTTAVNDELRELSYALRCLNQSYMVQGHRNCRAWTAGSCFVQPPVEQSLKELCGEADGVVKLPERTVEEQASIHAGPPADTSAPPNELPSPSKPF
ncbi:MAG: hypothetical protein KatS3mg113_1051 [Planctomycetaceae bacterium]|nr:MAG: hypothetical protein KatS3mg113_1051 [Planctomycetaceae bacterium]